jgi:ClpP class serine protease
MSQNQLPHIASRVLNTPLLLEPGYARTFFSALSSRINISELQDVQGKVEMDAQVEAYMNGYGGVGKPDRPYQVASGIAVIPVTGTLVHKLGQLRPYSGMTGYDGIVRNVQIACADPEVKGILLDLDSPGGEVAGCFDTARYIRELAQDKGKPLWASCYELNCSAAMALASAGSVRLITQTGIAGSVGVLMAHASFEKNLEAEGIKVTLIHSGAHKVDGNPYEDLPESVLAEFQRETDALRNDFANLVADNIGRPVADVLATEARTYRGQEAIDVGFADELINGNDAVDVFSSFLSEQGRTIIQPGGQSMKTDDQQQQAEQQDGADAADGQGTELVAATGNELSEIQLKARNDERKRISAIIGSTQAEGKTELAHHLAFETDMEADKAIGILEKSPVSSTLESTTWSGLDLAMGSQAKPKIGPGTEGAETDSRAAEMIGAHRLATGGQPPAN